MDVKTDQQQNAEPDTVEVGLVRQAHPQPTVDKQGIDVVGNPSTRLKAENLVHQVLAKEVPPALAIALELDLINSDPLQP